MNWIWTICIWISFAFVFEPRALAQNSSTTFDNFEDIANISSCNKQLFGNVRQLLSEIPRKHVPLDETKRASTVCWVHKITTVRNNNGKLINRISEYSLTFEALIEQPHDSYQEQDVHNSNQQDDFVTPGRVTYDSNGFNITYEKYVNCLRNPSCSEEEHDDLSPYGASPSETCENESPVVSSSEMASSETESSEMESSEMGSSEMGSSEMGSSEIGSSEMGSSETVNSEMARSEMSSGEMARSEMSSSEMSSSEMSSSEKPSSEMSSSETPSSEMSSSEMSSSFSSESTSAEEQTFPIVIYYNLKTNCYIFEKDVLFGACPNNLPYLPVVEKSWFPTDINMILVPSIPPKFDRSKMVVKEDDGCYMFSICGEFECPDDSQSEEYETITDILPTLQSETITPDTINNKCFLMKKILLSGEMSKGIMPTVTGIEYRGVNSKIISVKCPSLPAVLPVVEEKLFPDFVTFIYSNVMPDLSDKNKLLVKGENNCFVLNTVKEEECTSDLTPFVVMEIKESEPVVTPTYPKILEDLLVTNEEIKEGNIKPILSTLNPISESENQFSTTSEVPWTTKLEALLTTKEIPQSEIIKKDAIHSNCFPMKKILLKGERLKRIMPTVTEIEHRGVYSEVISVKCPLLPTLLPVVEEQLFPDFVTFIYSNVMPDLSDKNKLLVKGQNNCFVLNTMKEEECIIDITPFVVIEIKESEPVVTPKYSTISEELLVTNDEIKEVNTKPITFTLKRISESEKQFSTTSEVPWTTKLETLTTTEAIPLSEIIESAHHEFEISTTSIPKVDLSYNQWVTSAESKIETTTTTDKIPAVETRLPDYISWATTPKYETKLPHYTQWITSAEFSKLESSKIQEQTTKVKLSPSTERVLPSEREISDYNAGITSTKSVENKLLIHPSETTDTKLSVFTKIYYSTEKLPQSTEIISASEEADYGKSNKIKLVSSLKTPIKIKSSTKKLAYSEIELPENLQESTQLKYDFGSTQIPEQTTKLESSQSTKTIFDLERESSVHNKSFIPTEKVSENKLLTYPTKTTEFEFLVPTEIPRVSKKELSDYDQTNALPKSSENESLHQTEQTTESKLFESTETISFTELKLPHKNKWSTTPHALRATESKLSTPTEILHLSTENLTQYSQWSTLSTSTEHEILHESEQRPELTLAEPTDRIPSSETKIPGFDTSSTEEKSKEIESLTEPTEKYFVSPKETPVHKEWKTTLTPSEFESSHKPIETTQFELAELTKIISDLETELSDYNKRVTTPKYEEITSTQPLETTILKLPVKETLNTEKLLTSEKDLGDYHEWITTPLSNEFKLSHKPERTTQSVLLQSTQEISHTEAEFSEDNKLYTSSKPLEHKLVTNASKTVEPELSTTTEIYPSSKKEVLDHSQLNLQTEPELLPSTQRISDSEKQSKDYNTRVTTLEPAITYETEIPTLSSKYVSLHISEGEIESKLPLTTLNSETVLEYKKPVTTIKSQKLLTYPVRTTETELPKSTERLIVSSKVTLPHVPELVAESKLPTTTQRILYSEEELDYNKRVTTLGPEKIMTHSARPSETEVTVPAEGLTMSSEFTPLHVSELGTKSTLPTTTQTILDLEEELVYNKRVTTLKPAKIMTQSARPREIEVTVPTEGLTLSSEFTPLHMSELGTKSTMLPSTLRISDLENELEKHTKRVTTTEKLLTHLAETVETEERETESELPLSTQRIPTSVSEELLTHPVKNTETDFFVQIEKSTLSSKMESASKTEATTVSELVQSSKRISNSEEELQDKWVTTPKVLTDHATISKSNLPFSTKIFTSSEKETSSEWNIPTQFSKIETTQKLEQTTELILPQSTYDENKLLTYSARTIMLELTTAESTTILEEPEQFPIKIALVKTNNEGTQPTIENITCKYVDKHIETIDCSTPLTNDTFALFEEEKLPKFAELSVSNVLPNLNDPNKMLVRSERICYIFKLMGSVPCASLKKPLVVFLVTQENGEPITETSSLPTTISTEIALEITKYESVTTKIPTTLSEFAGSQDVITNPESFTTLELPEEMTTTLNLFTTKLHKPETTISEFAGAQDVITNPELFTTLEVPVETTTLNLFTTKLHKPETTLDNLSQESIDSSLECDESDESEESDESAPEFLVKIVQLHEGKQEENCYTADKHILRLDSDTKITPMAFVNEQSIPSDGSVHIVLQPFYIEKQDTIFAQGEENVFGFKIKNKIDCADQSNITTIVIVDDETMVSIEPSMETTTLLNDVSTTQAEELVTEPIVPTTVPNMDNIILYPAPNNTNICYHIEENMHLTTVPCPKDTSDLFQIQHPDIVQIICTERLKKRLRKLPVVEILKKFHVIQKA